MRTRSSQVIWADLDTTKLPDHILKRFANKTMAIVGNEHDRSRTTGWHGDSNSNYSNANQHYFANVWDSAMGSMVKVDKPSHYGHDGHGKLSTFKYHSPEDGPVNVGGVEIPPHADFAEGSGGEMRLSYLYHGYPKGYAQPVHNPDSWKINVMQIDTWNREEPSAKFSHVHFQWSTGVPLK